MIAIPYGLVVVVVIDARSLRAYDLPVFDARLPRDRILYHVRVGHATHTEANGALVLADRVDANAALSDRALAAVFVDQEYATAEVKVPVSKDAQVDDVSEWRTRQERHQVIGGRRRAAWGVTERSQRSHGLWIVDWWAWTCFIGACDAEGRRLDRAEDERHWRSTCEGDIFQRAREHRAHRDIAHKLGSELVKKTASSVQA